MLEFDATCTKVARAMLRVAIGFRVAVCCACVVLKSAGSGSLKV